MIENSTYQATSPVLMILFNRPKKALKLLNHIKQVKPKRLYIAVDGPRPDHPDDFTQIAENHRIAQEIDWDCTVSTLFQTDNLGCGLGPATAITWFFSQEEKGIILEDDCLPSTSFFRFCDELLEKYEHNTRIMQISGSNFFRGWQNDPNVSYYFSAVGSCWGWATWARAWKHYDFYATGLAELNGKGFLDEYFFSNIIEKLINQPNLEKEFWDFQWDFTKYIHSGLSIVPNTNTVENIGLGPDSTHSFDPKKYHFPNDKPLPFPLVHPTYIIKDIRSDQRYYQQFWRQSKLAHMKKALKKAMPERLWDFAATLLRHPYHLWKLWRNGALTLKMPTLTLQNNVSSE